jgi:hypothetical protein
MYEEDECMKAMVLRKICNFDETTEPRLADMLYLLSRKDILLKLLPAVSVIQNSMRSREELLR